MPATMGDERRRLAARELVLQAPLVGRSLESVQAPTLSFAAPAVVAGHPTGRLKEPATQRLRVLLLVDPAQQDHEDFLGQVVDIGCRDSAAPQDASDVLAVFAIG